MVKRITIQIDTDLLERAKKALGEATIRGTVEQALRRVPKSVESERARRAVRQCRYLEALRSRADLTLLASAEMWR